MSKFTEANKKIEKTVVETYEKVEDAVHGTYDKIGNTIVDTYKKVEDKFVDTFLKEDGETTEEAKERVKKEQDDLEAKNKARVEESLNKSKEINDKYTK